MRCSEETKKKISLANRGSIRTSEQRARMSAAPRKKRAAVSAETRQKISNVRIGMRFSPSHRKSLSDSKKLFFSSGKHPWNYKGGVPKKNSEIRSTSRYKEWRRAVFERDDYTCQSCGQRGFELEADHELPVSIFPDLIFEILNGRTLCKSCHEKTPTYKSKVRSFYALEIAYA